jgi:hypothetical protein
VARPPNARQVRIGFTFPPHFGAKVVHEHPHERRDVMRTFVRVFAALLVVALVIGIGTALYNAGVDAGLAAAPAVAASGDPVPVGGYGYGPYFHGWYGHGWGFGFFGIFFWILGIFLIIGLLRFAFGGGRWGGPGPRGRGGYGGWGDRRDRIEEWHAELHRREGGGGSVQES